MYPSGYRQQLAWVWRENNNLCLSGMGQALAERALQDLLDGGRPGWETDVRETNWVSMSAGLGRLVQDWAAKANV